MPPETSPTPAPPDDQAWSGVRRGPLRAGEWVRLTDSKGRRHNICLEPGKRFFSNRGHLEHDELIGRDEGFTVVKLFLNVSKEEQRLCFQDRIDDPEERWKFRLGDLDDRGLWDAYREAFQVAIRETTTRAAPWYVVPGDRKWVRNLIVAKIIRHHLEQIDPTWPAPEEGIDGLIVE